MATYCVRCGAAVEEGAKFCPNCGAAQAPSVSPAPVYAGEGAKRQGIPAPGFSDRVQHPEILAAVKRNRKAAGIFTLFFIPLPLIGAVIYSRISEDLSLENALLYGGIVSAIFLLFALIGLVRDSAKKPYEAVVTDKRTDWSVQSSRSDGNDRSIRYVTVVHTTAGKKKKIVEQEGSPLWAYQYLNVGDRFRYHPQFHFPYELYDKSRAPYLVCVKCGRHNPVEEDRCGKCGVPLLK